MAGQIFRGERGGGGERGEHEFKQRGIINDLKEDVNFVIWTSVLLIYFHRLCRNNCFQRWLLEIRGDERCVQGLLLGDCVGYCWAGITTFNIRKL